MKGFFDIGKLKAGHCRPGLKTVENGEREQYRSTVSEMTSHEPCSQ